MIETFEDISASYDALFCDLWGCVHDGERPFPAAVAALERFAAGGGKVILVTNSPRPRAAVARQLDRIGVARGAWHDIASSGDAAQAGMLAGVVGRRVFHLGPAKDESFFQDFAADIAADGAVERVAFEEAEGIVCTGLFDDRTEQPEAYRAMFLAAKARGLKLLCANPDIQVDMGDARIWCAGALAALYTGMGGESLYFGKPHPPIYDLARRRLAALGGRVREDRILCLGDGVGTDLRGAMGEDLDCLFISGGLAAAETGTGPAPGGQPEPARLASFLDAARMTATYTIGHLR